VVSLSSGVQTSQAPSGRERKEAEIAWWKTHGNSPNISDYEAYLERFGTHGEFAPLARSRIAALRSRTARSVTRPEAQRLRSDLEAAKEAVRKAEQFILDLRDDSDGLIGKLAGDMPLAKRLDIFRGFLGAVVDFPPMARFVLGRHQKTVSEAEFKEYLRYYEALFLKGYNFTRGDAWDGEIEVQEVRPYSTDYLVTLLLKPRKGDTEDVGLRIRRKPESYFGFKIIDVLYKGVSLLVTQRADFASTLRKEGVAGLIKKIEEKVGYEEEIIDIPG
jgi:phospholipid transport system substrate-binding protein